jgi:hypothetical protein
LRLPHSRPTKLLCLALMPFSRNREEEDGLVFYRAKLEAVQP